MAGFELVAPSDYPFGLGAAVCFFKLRCSYRTESPAHCEPLRGLRLMQFDRGAKTAKPALAGIFNIRGATFLSRSAS